MIDKSVYPPAIDQMCNQILAPISEDTMWQIYKDLKKTNNLPDNMSDFLCCGKNIEDIITSICSDYIYTVILDALYAKLDKNQFNNFLMAENKNIFET